MSRNNKNNFMHGSSLLLGDNTIPGLQIPKEVEVLIPEIFKQCKEFGLDFYPTVIQFLTYDEISEIAAYGGFPVRYPHWKWGMEYEELQRGYQYGMHRIYEMVINTNPCYIYCLDSNTICDNVTVIAHALGHNDFFKNNVFFSPTNQNMMNKLANNGTRIRKYIARWGKEKVVSFIDHCLRIETLIDPAQAWTPRKINEVIIRDSRKYRHPNRLEVQEGHEYMDDYINRPEWLDEQRENIRTKEIAEEIGIFQNPTKDVMGFLRDNANLKPWQSDIIAMLYEESMYFAPQRTTKMMNEGWASYVDMNIMCRQGLVSLGQEKTAGGLVEYAAHKMGVLGGKYSTNPYKIGFEIFMDIEERWNKGRFGREYEECDNVDLKNNWDRNLNLGHQKVFEVRSQYNDLMAIMDFFTPEFCSKHEFFNWKRYPNGDIRLENHQFKQVKRNLMKSYLNGGLPEIFLVDCNYKQHGYLLLEHKWEGEILLEPYVRPVLQSLYAIWGKSVFLCTKDKDEQEIVYCCYGDDDELVEIQTRQDHEKQMK